MSRDPYPETLDDIPFTPIEQTLEPLVPDGQVAALTRIAVALEQIALELVTRSQPVPNAPGATLTALPPVQTAQPVAAPPVAPVAQRPPPPKPIGVCPVHGTGWDKLVPAGVSKTSGKAYSAFWACPTAGCNEKPPR